MREYQHSHQKRDPNRAKLVETKVCCVCNINKPATEFRNAIRAPDGLSYICTECSAKKQSKKYWSDPKLARAIKNKKRIPQRKELARKAREHYANYPENHAKAMKKWREKNPLLAKQSTYNWRANNPSNVLAMHQRRRARKKNAVGDFIGEQFTHICEYYGGICLVYGRKIKLTADHVKPLSKGGSNYISNIQPLCGSCNSKKGAKHQDHRPAGWGNAFPQRLLTE